MNLLDLCFSCFDDEPTNQNNAGASSGLLEHEINPANGLPMIGSIDIEGNAYGIDDSFSSSGFDDW